MPCLRHGKGHHPPRKSKRPANRSWPRRDPGEGPYARPRNKNSPSSTPAREARPMPISKLQALLAELAAKAVRKGEDPRNDNRRPSASLRVRQMSFERSFCVRRARFVSPAARHGQQRAPGPEAPFVPQHPATRERYERRSDREVNERLSQQLLFPCIFAQF